MTNGLSNSANLVNGLSRWVDIVLPKQESIAHKYVAISYCEAIQITGWLSHWRVLEFCVKFLRTQDLFNYSTISSRWPSPIHWIKGSIRSSLAFCFRIPGEVPPTPDWTGELVAPLLGLLLLILMGESDKGSHASFRPKMGHYSAQPELLFWNVSNLGIWASPKTPKTTGTVTDGISDNPTTDWVTVQVALLPCTTKSQLLLNMVDHELAGIADLQPTSDMWLFLEVIARTII